jgi:FkbM family methyltransferase
MNIYRSDNGVDKRVEELFGDFVGHVCDVGANDGHYLSNSLLFEEKGWTVLCIEPNPDLAEIGRSRRKLWLEVAAGAEDSDEHEFGITGASPWASQSCLGVRSRHGGGGAHPNIVKVKVRTLDRLLDEAGFPKLDYLTVDVEGWEREVMSGFTVERWKPRVIVLEEWTENAIAIPGYEITDRLHYDNLYVRSDT